jgi:hypothetical protein
MAKILTTLAAAVAITTAQIVMSSQPSCAAASQPTSYRVTVLTQVLKSDRIALGGPVPSTTQAQDDCSRFNSLLKDNFAGGFLDLALKSAKLAQPINLDPKAMDPRFVDLTRSVSSYPQSADVFAISLTWNNEAEANAIVNALESQYAVTVGSHETLIVLDPASLAVFNRLELATFQYVHSNSFRYPTLKDQKVLAKQISIYLEPSDSIESAFTQNGQRIGINESLSDVSLGKVHDPAKTVLFYSNAPDKDGNRYIGYADGDCKLMTPDIWEVAKKTLSIP